MLKLFLLAFQLVFVQVQSDGQGYADYLYGMTSSPVREYTGTENIFLESTKPRVVEFYSPLCPACINFKPEYIQLAKATTKKYSDVQFYSVSCDKHQDVCQKFGVDGFPTLFAFQAGNDRKGKHIQELPSNKKSSYTPQLLAKKLHLDLVVAPGGTSKANHLRTSALNQRRMDDGPAFDGGEDEDDKESDENFRDEDQDENKDDEDDDTVNSDQKAQDAADQDQDDEDEDNQNDEIGDNKDDEDEYADIQDNESGENKDDEDGDNQDDEDEDNQDDEDKDNQDDEDEDKKDDFSNLSPPSGNAIDGGDEVNDGEDDEGDAKDEGSVGGRGYGPGMRPGGPRIGGSGMGGPGMRPGGPGRQRRPGAGSMMARTKPRDMDRYQKEMKVRRHEYADMRKGLGKIVRKDGAVDRKGKPIKRTAPEVMTNTMKAHKPGTSEYDERRKAMIERINKARRKQKMPPSAQLTTTSTLTKEALPYRKDVRKPTIKEKLPIVKRFVKMTAEEELILDTSLSLVVGLETGIFLKSGKDLGSEEKEALRKYLDLLSVSLPPEWGIHKLIDDLRSKFAFITKSDENLKSVLNQHPLPRRHWSRSCTGKRSMVGFSCGYWKLMHVVTVGVAEHRGGLNLIESGMVGDSTKTFSPIEAADTLRDYIEYFFTCTECTNNFLHQYDKCDNNRRCDRLTKEDEKAATADWKELSIWLWEFHNEVSVRIVLEMATKAVRLSVPRNAPVSRVVSAKEIVAIWPNIEICFMCFKEDGTWDEEQVFKFLERSYWPDSELDPRADRLLTFEGECSYGPGFLLWGFMFFIVWVVYKAIGSNSAAIHTNLVQAKQMTQNLATRTARTARMAAGGKKARTN